MMSKIDNENVVVGGNVVSFVGIEKGQSILKDKVDCCNWCCCIAIPGRGPNGKASKFSKVAKAIALAGDGQRLARDIVVSSLEFTGKGIGHLAGDTVAEKGEREVLLLQCRDDSTNVTVIVIVEFRKNPVGHGLLLVVVVQSQMVAHGAMIIKGASGLSKSVRGSAQTTHGVFSRWRIAGVLEWFLEGLQLPRLQWQNAIVGVMEVGW